MHAPSRPLVLSPSLVLSSRARVAACGVAMLEGKAKWEGVEESEKEPRSSIVLNEPGKADKIPKAPIQPIIRLLFRVNNGGERLYV